MLVHCANAKITRFPGKGRGPVAQVDLAMRSVRSLLHRDWAPAFAGEAGLVEMEMRRSIFGHALKQVQGDGECENG